MIAMDQIVEWKNLSVKPETWQRIADGWEGLRTGATRLHARRFSISGE
ncbi:MAG: hypothetical protein K0R47_1798 [Brevibacillus sp.]|nr:hypothetical protein [Brevibacillus sp.]